MESSPYQWKIFKKNPEYKNIDYKQKSLFPKLSKQQNTKKSKYKKLNKIKNKNKKSIKNNNNNYCSDDYSTGSSASLSGQEFETRMNMLSNETKRSGTKLIKKIIKYPFFIEESYKHFKKLQLSNIH